MSVAIPGWGAGEMIYKAKPKLFKMGWRRMENGRMDCIEKDFGDITIGTIWAGNELLLNTKRSDKKWNTSDNWPTTGRLEAQQKAAAELMPLFKRIVARNRKKWEAEIKEYESSETGHKVQRSEVYGI